MKRFYKEQGIETFIVNVLKGKAQIDALNFVEHLRINQMTFERAKGYWDNQLYWLVKFNNEYVCFILLDGKETELKFNPLTIWSDDSGSDWFNNLPLNDTMKEIAWKHVDLCENCGSCSGGTNKVIFGKQFNNICRTTFRFINPDTKTFEFIKTMVDMRKSDIINNV